MSEHRFNINSVQQTSNKESREHGRIHNTTVDIVKQLSDGDEEIIDPEHQILVKILEQMLKKHKLTSPLQKSEYRKFKVRQWESIEDKLKSLNNAADGERQKMPFDRDFIKQVKDHIKEVIRTGKAVKLNTLSNYLEQENKFVGKQANVQIKLQQLKTTRLTRNSSITRNNSSLEPSEDYPRAQSININKMSGTIDDMTPRQGRLANPL